MDKLLWKFEGFVTDAGNRVVQSWYWDEIAVEERDVIRDRINYLGNIERHLWIPPKFKFLNGIAEIRKKTPKGALRIYGYFPNADRVFVLLYGVLKKQNNDKPGIENAKLRLKKLKQGLGSTHEFDFKEKPSRASEAEQNGEKPTRCQ